MVCRRCYSSWLCSWLGEIHLLASRCHLRYITSMHILIKELSRLLYSALNCQIRCISYHIVALSHCCYIIKLITFIYSAKGITVQTLGIFFVRLKQIVLLLSTATAQRCCCDWVAFLMQSHHHFRSSQCRFSFWLYLSHWENVTWVARVRLRGLLSFRNCASWWRE